MGISSLSVSHSPMLLTKATNSVKRNDDVSFFFFRQFTLWDSCQKSYLIFYLCNNYFFHNCQFKKVIILNNCEFINVLLKVCEIFVPVFLVNFCMKIRIFLFRWVGGACYISNAHIQRCRLSTFWTLAKFTFFKVFHHAVLYLTNIFKRISCENYVDKCIRKNVRIFVL